MNTVLMGRQKAGMAQHGKHFFLLKDGGLLQESLANRKDGTEDRRNTIMRKKSLSL